VPVEPARPDGLATRAVVVGVAAWAGLTVVAFVTPEVALVPPVLPVPLVAVVLVWSDSSVAFALARDAWAAVAALCSGRGLMLASV
jgi:hypothetical protein